MKNPIENVDSVEVIDSNIIDAIKTIRHRNKKRPDENTIGDYFCKSYPDCNVTTICQRITYLENKNKILNKLHNGKNSYYLIDDSAIIPDDSVSLEDPQSIPLFDLETPRVNPIKKQVTLIQDLNEKLLSLSTEINTLKSFVLEQVFVIKKTIQDIQELPNNKETNNGYVTSLTDQINFLKEENKTKNTIIQIYRKIRATSQNNWKNKNSYFLKKFRRKKLKVTHTI